MPARAASRSGLPPRKAAPPAAPSATPPESADTSVLDLFEGEAMDAATSLKLEALAALHERKVATLMRSIAAKGDEIAKLKNEAKEHRRSRLIQELRDALLTTATSCRHGARALRCLLEDLSWLLTWRRAGAAAAATGTALHAA